MPFDWQDFLKLARYLHDNPDACGSPEAAWRTATSRAYYSAFGYALEYACKYLDFEPKSKETEKSRDHGRLRECFKGKRRANVAQRLDRLRIWRNNADYEADLGDANLADMSGGAIADAEYVFIALPPPRPPEGTESS